MLMLRDAAEIPVARRKTLGELARDTLPLLLKSAGMTVLLSCLAFPLAVSIGLAVAVGRMYGPMWLRPLLTAYVEVLRGTPLMLQLYAIFFLLPKIGLALPAVVAAVIGLALNYSAYESEIYRAGLKAVPLGQFEASLSLGLSKWQALRHVLVPQAVRIVMPPVTSDFIALFKDTSVCSAITVIELTKRYSVLALSTGRIVELAVVTALLYLCMSWPLALLSRWFERRLERSAAAGATEV
jgi:polar amino acid transport system substrate-binding protein